jgi:hypothetical protein
MNPGLVMGPGVKYHENAESFSVIRKLGNDQYASGCPNIAMGVVDVRVSNTDV